MYCSEIARKYGGESWIYYIPVTFLIHILLNYGSAMMTKAIHRNIKIEVNNVINEIALSLRNLDFVL